MKFFIFFCLFLITFIFSVSCSYEDGNLYYVVEDESLYYNDTIVSIFGPDTVKLSPHQYQRDVEMAFSYYLLQAYSIRQANIPENYVSFPDPQSLYFSVMDTLKGGHYTYYIPNIFVYNYLQGFDLPSSTQFGFQLQSYNDTVYIYRIFNNTPAYNAGLRRGDKILHANRYPLYGNIDVFNAATRPGNVDHSIVYSREGVIDSVVAKKERVTLPVSYSDSLSENVGYIYLSTFIASSSSKGGSTADQLRRSLNETRHFPITIIDMRNNGGGYISQSYETARMFLSAGDTLVIESGRTSTIDEIMGTDYQNVIKSKSNGIEKDRDFVFLVNSNSASGTEILVSAVTYNRDLPVVGTRTYGKAIGQSSIQGRNGGMAHITSVEFLYPDGSSYAYTGIVPDYEVSFSINNFEDEMLIKAIEVAESKLDALGFLTKRSSQSLREDDALMKRVSGINSLFSEYEPITGFPEMGFIEVDFDL